MNKTHTTKSISGRIAKGSTAIFFLTLLASPFGYAVRLLYSRTLSIEYFGLLFSVIAFFSLFENYSDLGSGYPVTYLVPKYEKKKDFQSILNVYFYHAIVQLFSSLLILTVVIMFRRYLAQFYFKQMVAVDILIVLSFYYLFSSIGSTLKRLYVGLQKEQIYSFAQPLRLSITLITSFLFWYLGYGLVEWFALSWVFGSLSVLVFFILYLYLSYPFLIRLPTVSVPLIKKMMKFSFPSLMTRLSYLGFSQVGILLLTFFHSVSEVGRYNIVVPLISISALFLSPMSSMIVPLTSELAETNSEKLHRLVSFLIRFVPLAAVYFTLFIWMFDEYSIGLLFGNDKISLVKNLVPFLAVSYIFSTLASYLMLITDGMGLVKEKLSIVSFVTALSLVLQVVLIISYSTLGLAISVLLSQVVLVVALFNLLRKHMAFNIPLDKYGYLFGFSIVLLFAAEPLKFLISNWFSYILAGMVYTVVFIVFSLVSGYLDKRNLAYLFLLVSKTLKKKNFTAAEKAYVLLEKTRAYFGITYAE